MEKLLWKNLLKNRCPKCGETLQFFPQEEMLMCNIMCGFMIREGKMQAMVSKMTGERLERKRPSFTDNLGELNNMGHDKIYDYDDTEDE